MQINRKKSIIFTCLGLLMLILTLGVTYAYFYTNIAGVESASTLSGTGANLEVTFTDGNSTISGTNVFPGWSATKTFTVSNTGDDDTYYQLKLTKINNNLVTGGLSYQIVSTDGLGYTSEKEAVPTSDKNVGIPILIAKNATHNYRVTVYYNNLNVDQSSDANKNFSVTTTITGASEPYPKGWLRASTGTLLAGIKKNQKTIQRTYTNPGTQISTTDEGLRKAEDDYGVSLYYRGDVNNNFVVFAGMCWRIVRVDGNGNTKIVLYNYDKTATNPCNVTGTDLAYARDANGNLISQTWSIDSSTNNRNAYIGLMYGSTDINASYDDAHANTNESGVLGVLKTWYTNNISSTERDKLADVVWCNDKSLASPDYNTANWTGTINTGAGVSKTYYKSEERIYPVETAKPSLKCPNSSLTNQNLSRFTAGKTTDINGNGKLTIGGVEYKIGLLTADEVAYAGAQYASINTNYYLNKNANDYAWWTLSPASFNGSTTYMLRVWSSGYLGNERVSNPLPLRPAVSLKSNTKVTTRTAENPGTQNNPFIVQ